MDDDVILHQLWIPRRFYEDHVERDLPAGRVISQDRSRVLVVCDDEALDDLESDARHYADHAVARDLGPDYAGLCTSARYAVQAIEKYRQQRKDTR